jgi:integrase
MSTFAKVLAERVENYIQLRRSLGYTFCKQAATLRTFVHYAEIERLDGPLTRHMALDFVLAIGGTPNGRAIRHAVLRRFCEYFAIYDARTESLDPRAFPRSRAVPPPHILSDEELALLISACRHVSPTTPHRARTLATLVGLLASTGMRSGEALRLDRADVDLVDGILQIRKTKFRKDRLVPVHATTLAALREYARLRDIEFPVLRGAAFFLNLRGNRLSSTGLSVAFRAACRLADIAHVKGLRPHALRHRFAVARLVAWYRERPRCSTKLTHLRSGELILRVRGRWRPGTSGWVDFIRVFLCSAATRFLRSGHTHRTAPRAAAVKTGRRPPPQAVVLTAVSMARASTRPDPAPRGWQLAMARTIC